MDLIPKDDVLRIVSSHDAALEAYEEYFRCLTTAYDAFKRAEGYVIAACNGESSAFLYDKRTPEIEAYERVTKEPDIDMLRSFVYRMLRIKIWGAIVDQTNIRHLMDKKAKEDLRNSLLYKNVDYSKIGLVTNGQLSTELPPINYENITSTIDGFAEQAGEIWKRGIANAFTRLDRRFRSHNGFKLGSRIILTNVFNEHGSWNCYRKDEIIDVERILFILDGISPDKGNSILDKITDRNWIGNARQSVYETEYLIVKAYINGNAHLWFRRKDLIDKVNLLLAEHYGEVLGWGSEPDVVDDPFENSALREPAKNLGFFPTPPEVAERVIEKARINYYYGGGSRLKVLEPSAGTGSLSNLAAESHDVTVVELDAERGESLAASGLYEHVMITDFLSIPPPESDKNKFDRIIMNPPFDRRRDVDHIIHALKFLRDDGILVSVVMASLEWSEDKKASNLRSVIEDRGGSFYDLPVGSFKASGTNVNTAIVTLYGSRECSYKYGRW